MRQDFDDDHRLFKVVVNDEEQYALWWAEREIPRGWRDTGKSGSKKECMTYVDEVWTDMRPLSLRRQEEAKKSRDSEPGQ